MTLRAWFFVALVGGLAIAVAMQFLPGGPSGALVAVGVFGLVGMAYLALQVLAMTRAQSNRFPHTGFIRRGGAGFVLPSNGRVEMLGVAGALFLPVLASNGIVMWQLNTADTADFSTRYLDATALVTLVCGVGVLVLISIIVGRGRGGPSVALSPQGIEARQPYGTRRIGWAALDPQAPVSAVAMPMGTVRFAIADATEVRDSGLLLWRVRLPWEYRGLTPEQFAATVTHYVQHPQERAAIGTEAELARLNIQLGLAPVGAEASGPPQ